MRNKFMTIRMTENELQTIYQLCDDVNLELDRRGSKSISKSQILRRLFEFMCNNKKWIVDNY